MQRLLTLPLALALAGMLGIAASHATAQSPPSDGNYRVGPGDVVLIEVFGEADLSMEVMLDDTGVIDYPFLGELEIEGLTVGELEAILLGGLKGPYLVDPDITVAIKQYRNVYLTGEVQEPGGFPYQPGLTVEKAIALAGGFTERASRSKIELKRGDDPDERTFRVKLSDQVRPGDIIQVPRSFF